jgi:hypothetical protein
MWWNRASSAAQARSAHLPHACELLGVQPEDCVYLDDLGINLKPARAHRHAHHQGRRSRRGDRRAAGDGRHPAAGLTVKRPARPITAKYLQNAGDVLSRALSRTAEGLRRVLNRRVRKAEMAEAPVMDNVSRRSRRSSPSSSMPA